MTTKTFSVGFYQGQFGDNNTVETVGDHLRGWADDPATAPLVTLHDTNYELRNLRPFNQGQLIWGEYVKFRDKDLPHIGQMGGDGDEREIDLDDREGLIEKNHFIFYKRHQLLIYQNNKNANTINQFARFFTEATGEVTIFNPILRAESMARLMRGEVRPKYVEVSYARPTNSEAVASDDWTNKAFGILNASGGNNALVRISLGRGPRGRFLNQSIKQSIAELIDQTNVSIARLIVDDDGIEHPIDLIADRLKDKIQVKMEGRYPDRSDIYRQLDEAKRRQNHIITDLLGEGENALV